MCEAALHRGEVSVCVRLHCTEERCVCVCEAALHRGEVCVCVRMWE